MKFVKTLLASALVSASLGAHALTFDSITNAPIGPILTLTGTGLTGVATLVGGDVRTEDASFASDPEEAGFDVASFLAAPGIGAPAVLSFGAGVSAVSFLWGSPDDYNVLKVLTTAGLTTYMGASTMGFPEDGDQSFAHYVAFYGGVGESILSLTFYNSPTIDAFEVANFSVPAIPEPETYALMMAGLGAIGFMARRRRNKA